MSWQTPKTDWNASNAPVPPDMNRIEENIRVLGQGGRKAATTLTAAAAVDIGDTDDTFLVSGTTSIKYLSTTGRVAGNKIYLVATNNINFLSNQSSPPSGYAPIYLFKIGVGPAVVDLNIGEGAVVMLVYAGGKWLLTY
ncbi:MAG: hypothetical protein GX640_01935 [Fibrobacter sp.]|nr:hypothetical protein [Fibrobacter sp.]